MEDATGAEKMETEMNRLEERQAWAEVEKRVRVFSCVQFMAALVVLVSVFAVREIALGHATLWVWLLAIGIALVIHRVVLNAVGDYVNAYRCPHCGESFLRIDADLRAPFRGSRVSKRWASCQHCGFVIWKTAISESEPNVNDVS